MQRNAWYLTLNNRYTLAMAQQQVVEYITDVESLLVPQCNPNCQHVIIWRDRVVPVWGVSSCLSANTQNKTHQLAHVLIACFQIQHQTQLIALSLLSAPVMISVSDQDQCTPTDKQTQYWKQSIISCFEHQGSAVPIVDLAVIS